MTAYELLALIAAIVSGTGERTTAGSVAQARELLDELRRQEPDLYAAHVRRQRTDAQRRHRES